jgi:glutamine amidotransferase
LGVAAEVTSDPDKVRNAERVIFPGVGAAGAAMANLREMGLVDPLREVFTSGRPFLGICLGTQVIFEFSEEDGGEPCMGFVPGRVQKFQPSDPMCKVPHMGWNTVKQVSPHPLMADIEDDSEFYFVHSYYPNPSDASYVRGTTEYADVVYASMVGKDNFFATQFHPERSGRIGLKLLENFSRWDGKC